MIRNFYSPIAAVVCLIAAASNVNAYEGGSLRTRSNSSTNVVSGHSTPGFQSTLEPLVLYDEEVDQTSINFYWTNVNAGSQTEIYRSLDPDDGYTLVATQDADDDGYGNFNLKPRTNYYYRLRAVRGDETSEYMYLNYTTFSRNFAPTITTTVLDARTIQVEFTDNSYNDIDYYIFSQPDAPNQFFESIAMPDSGRTVTYTHTASPGTTYSYSVTMTYETYPRGGTSVDYNDLATATTPTENIECPGAGSIEREIWYDITGTSVSSIPVNSPPDEVNTLNSFETENYKGNNYGSRVRGFICPPATGNYQFYIASDDQSELWLSTSENPSGKVKIASVPGYAPKNNFTKYPSQKSIAIALTQGQRYYVEVLHKEGTGADFLQVGWKLPSGQEQVPIPGSQLIRYDYTPPSTTCFNSGTIDWEVWKNFTGTLETIPVNTAPTNKLSLTKFESPQYYGNSYGSRARGYVCVPSSGSYTFYLSADDRSRLYLSTDSSPFNKQLIAETTSATKYNEWNKYPSQTSAPVTLVAGELYYIEVLHQEVSGNDFIQVGWKKPDGTVQQPIPGDRLVPYTPLQNQNPVVTLTSPEQGEVILAPATIRIAANATDSDGAISKVEFYNGATKLGEDSSAPYEYTWTNVGAGEYTIIAKAIDNNLGAAEDDVSVTVTNACAGSGQISREVWFGVAGSNVSDIPLNTTPQYVHYITSLETPQYFDNRYGARIRGYLCVPTTGSYRFFISSDDQSELWLSTDDDASNKQRIAAVPGHTPFRYYEKYNEQKSAVITLTAGYRYYIEVLHKEGSGNDHVSVAWEMPGGAVENPIPGNRLLRLQDANTSMAAEEVQVVAAPETEEEIRIYPNPVTERQFTLGIANPLPVDEAKIQIISANGIVVKDELISCGGDCTELLIRLNESVDAGLYMVNVMQGKNRKSAKLVLK